MMEITALQDPLLGPWLDLYQKSFPLGEQALVSTHLTEIGQRACGAQSHAIHMAATDEDGLFLGLSNWEMVPQTDAAALWYLAVKPTERSRGVGSAMYRHIARQCRCCGARALVIEVEDPASCHGSECRADAERRISFYKRNGACLLSGIAFTLSVGWQPPMPMSVMIHPFEEMDPDTAFALCRCILGDGLQQVGALGLEPQT